MPQAQVGALQEMSANTSVIETDAVVIGAGPVGLYQVFQLGLLEVKAHVIDALPYPGGQCAELYPDKPIYDIPSVPVCTGRELTQNLISQIAPLGATFHYSQVVNSIQRQADGRFLVETSQHTRLLAKTIFIAAGVGAFQPRTLQLDGIEAFASKQLAYSVQDPAAYANQNVLIVGDNEAALQCALRLCSGNADGHPHKARSVTLVHRRDAFTATPATTERFRALVAARHLQFLVGQPTGFDEAQGVLRALRVTTPDAITTAVALDTLLVFQGLSPKLGPIAQWGLELERKQLVVDTEMFSTSVPGIFAVGDINTYPGKKKLIVCGFHECVQAAFGAMPIIRPGEKVMLQYTTTSTKLHKVLGVESKA
jgi:thioredoxin reductase (NADPH)